MDQIGFRSDLPSVALPSLTWKALAKLPVVVVTVGLLLSGVYHIKQRKSQHA
jgi:hypothetical protein